MKYFSTVVLLLASVSPVMSHASFQQLWVDGVDQAGTCVRKPAGNSPVQDVASLDMRCNAGSAAAASKCSVGPGANITVEMHQHETRSCTEEAIGGAHRGPTIIYMSKVADAATADGSSSWFKVSELGYDTTTKQWADEVLNNNCGHYSFNLPSDIAAGDYLVRAEQIALHSAASVGGAQFYMSCYQLTISGSGTAIPAAQVLIPSSDVYTATDAGIQFDLYGGFESYAIPGPAVYSGLDSTASDSSIPAVASPSSSAAASAISPISSMKAVAVELAATPTSALDNVIVSSAPKTNPIAIPTTLQTVITAPAATSKVAGSDEPSSAPTAIAVSPESATMPTDAASLANDISSMPEGTTLANILTWLSEMLSTMTTA